MSQWPIRFAGNREEREYLEFWECVNRELDKRTLDLKGGWPISGGGGGWGGEFCRSL